jgi:cell wall-associated NlpC family hydrolase
MGADSDPVPKETAMAVLPLAPPRRLLRVLLPVGTAAVLLVGAGGLAASQAAAPAAIALPQSQATQSSPVGTALYFALTQMGKPYVWGAAGPSAYDCSGLTMAAYAAAGIALPHNATLQYNYGAHVPFSQAQPGDLVFRATDPNNPATIYHVSIYLGNGMLLSARYTGTVVQIQPNYTANLVPMVTRPASASPPLLSVNYGDVGGGVRAVQQRLLANGYQLAVDGGYGPITLRAVRGFQAAHQLSVSGVVDPTTWGALVSYGAMLSPS